MPSRSMVRRAARAVGITRVACRVRDSVSSSTSVWRVDRLDLGHDQVRPLARDQRAQRGAVEHVEHVAAMRDLHRRRVGVAVGGDHLDAEALQFDRHFLAQFARAEQQHARGVRRQRRADRGHRRSGRVTMGRVVYRAAAPRAHAILRAHAPARACPRRSSPVAALLRRVRRATQAPQPRLAGVFARPAARRNQRPRRVARVTATRCGCTTTAAIRRDCCCDRAPTARARDVRVAGATQHRLGRHRRVRSRRQALPADRRHRRQRRPAPHAATARGRGTGAAARRRRAAPAWSIAFRWPDGARDCEAIAVDARARRGAADLEEARAAGAVRRAAAPDDGGVQTAQPLGTLAGVPQPSRGSELRRTRRARARPPDHRRRPLARRPHARGADLPPPAALSARAGEDLGAGRRARRRARSSLPWLPQAEAIALVAADGRQPARRPASSARRRCC